MDLIAQIGRWIKTKVYSDESEMNQDNLEYKILILGEKGVGKTCFIKRYCKNEFSLEEKPSIEIEAYVKGVRIYNETIKVCIIDTIENILSLERKELYNNTHGVIILYDITKTSTFEKLDKYIIDIKQQISASLPILLIGHKKDLTFLRNIDYEEGIEKANKKFCDFYETTCLDEDSVDKAINYLIAKIYYNNMSESKKKLLKFSYKEDNIQNIIQEEKEEEKEINITKLIEDKEDKDEDKE